MRTFTFRLATRRSLRLAASAFLVAALGTLGAHQARAAADTFGVGDAHGGNLTVAGAGTQVNSYAALATSAAANATVLTIGSVNGAAFAANDLVLIWRATGLTPAPVSGDQTAVDLSSSSVGAWELGRVASTGAGTLTLTAGLLSAFASGVTQIVRVPEFDTLTIGAAGSIIAPAWDGAVGGIVAFFANSVTNNGGVLADGIGFRGGIAVNNAGALGCTANDGLPATGHALKGEGLVPSAYALTSGGRGNVANGAGGGDCLNSGGGGGGNGSVGGKGGRSYSNYGASLPLDDNGRDVGGLGGAALTYSLLSRLTLGGGGGAGDENSNSGSGGGAGGGVVFVRAGTLVGGGTMAARGQTPAQASVDGAGGGGAGGSIVVRLYGTGTCAQLLATGGNGASNAVNTYGPHGPGGAGGGGRILLQSTGGNCSGNTNASSGLAGTQDSTFTSPFGPAHGATPPTTAIAGIVEPPPPGGFCATNAQCTGATPFCAVNGSCRACVPSDCAGTPSTPVCPATGTTCLPATDAGAGEAGAGDAAAGDAGAGDSGAGDASTADGSAADGSTADGSAASDGSTANDGSAANDGSTADDGSVANDGSADDGAAANDAADDATLGYGGTNDAGTRTGGGGSSSGDASGAAPTGDVVEGGGCACTLASSDAGSGGLAMLGFAATALLAGVRRRRK